MNEKEIFDMQSTLRELSYYYNISRIIPDGVYGTQTSNAVSDFQKLFGLPATGEADEQTLDAIKKARKELASELKNWKDLGVFNKNWVCQPGQKCVRVQILQQVLQFVSMRFANVPKVEVTGEYDKQTIEAVTKIQTISNLNATGMLDKQSWERIVAIFEAYAP